MAPETPIHVGRPWPPVLWGLLWPNYGAPSVGLESLCGWGPDRGDQLSVYRLSSHDLTLIVIRPCDKPRVIATTGTVSCDTDEQSGQALCVFTSPKEIARFLFDCHATSVSVRVSSNRRFTNCTVLRSGRITT